MTRGLLLFLVVLLCGVQGLRAQSSSKVQSLKKQQSTALQNIKSTNQQIDKTQKTQLQALHRLESLSTEIAHINDSIKSLNAEISRTVEQQRKLSADIAALERTLAEKKESYAKAVRSMTVRRDDRYDALMFVLSAASLEQAYRRFREAGADRYLLRHETRNDAHYARLHPAEMSGTHRRDCLRALKELGYQVGAGMMVGSPGQTVDCLLDDIAFLEELRPEMIGMGPFVPAAHTPFARHAAGSVDLTLRLIALMRLRFPDALIPATTALATLDGRGREEGIRSGANVVMPNLSPVAVRERYSIYDGKASWGSEAAEGLRSLEQELNRIGCHIAYGRGDYPGHGGGLK